MIHLYSMIGGVGNVRVVIDSKRGVGVFKGLCGFGGGSVVCQVLGNLMEGVFARGDGVG